MNIDLSAAKPGDIFFGRILGTTLLPKAWTYVAPADGLHILRCGPQLKWFSDDGKCTNGFLSDELENLTCAKLESAEMA